MIYRLVIDECLEGLPTGRGRLGGLTNSHFLSRMLDECDIPSPSFDNPKTRFYFTEAGWKKAGRLIAAEAKRQEHVVKCIRRKNPQASQVVYRDKFQVAILPSRRVNDSK
jgi:hypothetical protein